MRLDRDKVNIWSFVMGSGKTQNWINIINKNPDIKILYVTPFLEEVDRIKKSCYGFVEPMASLGRGRKSHHLQELVNDGKSIVTTHKLFKELAYDDYSIFSEYTLVLDEVLDVVVPIRISNDDVDTIINSDKLVSVDEDKKVTWIKPDYKGFFDKIKMYVETGNVILLNGTSFVWSFPPVIFKSFYEVVVLTYLFEGSILQSYFLYNNIAFRIESEYAPSFNLDRLEEINSLIDVYDGEYNTIGNKRKNYKTPLTKTWYEKKGTAHLTRVSDNTRNFFRTYCKTKSEFNLYTTFKDYKSMVGGKGFARGFISVNERATNKFRHKTSLAYLVDRRINPTIKHYFAQKEIRVNEDIWSLSEMIQWLWRGCVRDNEPMKVFIPSQRMRSLLLKWLNGEM